MNKKQYSILVGSVIVIIIVFILVLLASRTEAFSLDGFFDDSFVFPSLREVLKV